MDGKASAMCPLYPALPAMAPRAKWGQENRKSFIPPWLGTPQVSLPKAAQPHNGTVLPTGVLVLPALMVPQPAGAGPLSFTPHLTSQPKPLLVPFWVCQSNTQLQNSPSLSNNQTNPSAQADPAGEGLDPFHSPSHMCKIGTLCVVWGVVPGPHSL